MDGSALSLEQKLLAKTQECEELKAILAYEEKEFEYKFLSRQSNLISEVKRLIGIDLENIEAIAEHIPEKNKHQIHKCISHMWKQIEKLSKSDKEVI